MWISRRTDSMLYCGCLGMPRHFFTQKSSEQVFAILLLPATCHHIRFQFHGITIFTHSAREGIELLQDKQENRTTEKLTNRKNKKMKCRKSKQEKTGAKKEEGK